MEMDEPREWPIDGCVSRLAREIAESEMGMLRIVAYGVGAVGTLYLVVVLGVLMSWRQRALAEGRYRDDFTDTAA